MQLTPGTFDFLQERRRLLAIMLVSLAGTAVVVFLVARGELAGADARAYWGGVRVWLDGGSPMAPPAPYLPYVYAPWSVPIFLPWALLPWDVAWFVWRGVNVLLLLWSASWAYKQHPMATAILLCVLAAPIAATLDTGNITLLCALGIWAAHFVGPRLGGVLWALATVLKWFPAPLWLILPGRARLWGLVWMAIALLLALATWPQTVAQMQAAIAFPRPFRLDYLLLVWACVPWIWMRPRLFDPAEWRPLAHEIVAATQQQGRELRSAPRPGRAAIAWITLHLRSMLGIAPRAPSAPSEPVAAVVPPAPTG
ncbi:MAG: DUF2029 domain-containing protein [Chloroflexi bacterium]|nr:DUF2029 domain-containing protein [Chloroflexota bacterium]